MDDIRPEANEPYIDYLCRLRQARKSKSEPWPTPDVKSGKVCAFEVTKETADSYAYLQYLPVSDREQSFAKTVILWLHLQIFNLINEFWPEGYKQAILDAKEKS